MEHLVQPLRGYRVIKVNDFGCLLIRFLGTLSLVELLYETYRLELQVASVPCIFDQVIALSSSFTMLPITRDISGSDCSCA